MSEPINDIILTGINTARTCLDKARTTSHKLDYVAMQVQSAIDALQVVEAKVKARQLATAQAEERRVPRFDAGNIEHMPRYIAPHGDIREHLRGPDNVEHQHPLDLTVHQRPEPWNWFVVFDTVKQHTESHTMDGKPSAYSVALILLVLERLGLIPKFNHT